MHRRDALKALAGIASAAGLTVTPITAKEAEGVELVLIKSDHRLTSEQCARLKEQWLSACADTPLQHVRAVVFSGMDVEIVRQTRT